eukprot:gene624-8128_t
MEIVSYQHDEIESQMKMLKIKMKQKNIEKKVLISDFNNLKTNIEKMESKLQSITDEHIFETFELFLDEHKINLNSLKNEIEEYHMIHQQNSFAEVEPEENILSYPTNDTTKFKDDELEKELFFELFENEKELLEATKRLLIQGEETLKLADNCDQMLKEQDEDMDVMIENLNIIESNTEKAKKEMVGIFKKLFAEKLIICLIIGLIIIICGIVLFKVLDIIGVWKAILKK